MESRSLKAGRSYPKSTFKPGRSTDRGFFVYGAVDTDELHMAVNEALARLRGGEHTLAVRVTNTLGCILRRTYCGELHPAPPSGLLSVRIESQL